MMMIFFSYFLSFSSSLSMHACMRANLNKRTLLYYFFLLDNYDYIRIIISQFFIFNSFRSSLLILLFERTFFSYFHTSVPFFFAIYFSMCPIILILVVARNVIECKRERKKERTRIRAFMQVSCYFAIVATYEAF